MEDGRPSYQTAPSQQRRTVNYTYERGTYGGGFALGFLFGVTGIIVTIAVGMPKTRRGAVTGYFVRMGLSIIILVCVWAFYSDAILELLNRSRSSASTYY